MYTERLTTLMFCGCFLLLCYIIILGLIVCDHRAGVRKAKQRGEIITSDGHKRTIEKISKYFNMTFAMSIIDVLQLTLILFLYHFYSRDIIMLPWFTLIAVGYVGFVEIKSIWEPADVKEKKQMQDYRRAILALIREYGGIDKILEVVMQDQKERENAEFPKQSLNADNF